MVLDPVVFGCFDLAALVQPHRKLLFVCFFLSFQVSDTQSRMLLGWIGLFVLRIAVGTFPCRVLLEQ